MLSLTGVSVRLRKEKINSVPTTQLPIMFCWKACWVRDPIQFFMFHNYQQTKPLWISYLPSISVPVFGFPTIPWQWVQQFVLSEKCFVLFLLNQVCDNCKKCPLALILWGKSEPSHPMTFSIPFLQTCVMVQQTAVCIPHWWALNFYSLSSDREAIPYLWFKRPEFSMLFVLDEVTKVTPSSTS